MKSKFKKWKFIFFVVAIIMVVTIGYMTIYAGNPYIELSAKVGSLRDGSIKDTVALELVGITGWVNLPDNNPLALAGLKGRVVLIDFWAYGCATCQRDLSYLTAWDKKYRPYGLEIIGVHTPEFRSEMKLGNVASAVKKYNIEYPVALDNDYKTWRAFRNSGRPAKYLIDANGQVVYTRFGEGGYDEIEQKIQVLLQEANLLKVEQIKQGGAQ